MSRFQKAPPKAPDPTNHDRLSVYLVGCDAAARAMESKWGVGRLPMLVSAETLLRFKQANDLLNATINANDADRMTAVAAMMVRAWGKLDSEATERGHAPLAPNTWEALLDDGRVLILVRTNAEAHQVASDNRSAVVYTAQEIARLIPQFELLNAIKRDFVGATVTKTVHKAESFAQDFCTSDPFLEIAHGVAA